MSWGIKGQKLADKATTWWFRLFTLKRLPSLWFWGVTVKQLVPSRSEVRLPFSWFSQNPFKSVYFSAMGGAAELSTGLLVMSHLADRGAWSMLVTSFQMEFFKKSKEAIYFSCEQGDDIISGIESRETTDSPVTLELISIGKTKEGDVVAKAKVQWSLKAKV